MRRLSYANLRAAWWALWTARRARRELESEGLSFVLPGPPAGLPPNAERGVRAALRRSGASCLVSSLVRQRWEVAHGRRRDLIVGVTGPADFRAHAWLEGDPVPPAAETDEIPDSELPAVSGVAAENDEPEAVGGRRYQELLRQPAPG